MKLVAYEIDDTCRAGVLVDDQIVDAAEALGADEPLRDIQALLEHRDRPVERLRDAVERGGQRMRPLSSVRLRSPILRPPTVRDFSLFEEHMTQQFTRGQEDSRPDSFGVINLEPWRRMPIFYFSNTLCVYGHDEPVPYPAASTALDYECEIAAVVGREGINVPEADAHEYLVGFTIMNDWSARDLQADEMRVTMGPVKGKDFATSLGPWIVTPDELAQHLEEGVLSVRCQVRVNGETWTDRSAWNMTHSFGAMVERASQDSRVVPGDVLGTGTVGGGTVLEAARLGLGGRWLQPGDVVELEVEGLGILRNRLSEPLPRARPPRYPSSVEVPLPTPLPPDEVQAVLERVTPPSDSRADGGGT